MIYTARPLPYDPNRLLNHVMRRLGLSSDGGLAQHLKMGRAVIRDIRDGRLPISATIVMVLHQATGISIGDLRFLLGDRRATFRMGVRLASPASGGFRKI